MHVYRFHQLPKAALALGLTALAWPLAAHAQVREVVSKQVSVGRSEATLQLEFSDRGELEISFDDGSVLVDGDEVGSFEPGGPLDRAWRELLGQAVSLEDGPLSQALADWSPPDGLSGRGADVAGTVDRALESAVRPGSGGLGSDVTVSLGDGNALVRAMVTSPGRLALLQDALADIDEPVRVHVAENVEVGADEEVEGSLVGIESDVRVRGRIDGDLVVVGGSVELLDGSRVGGSLRLADARLVDNEGSVGDVVRVTAANAANAGDSGESASEIRTRVREQVREEVRNEVREETRDARRDARSDRRDRDGEGFSLLAPFRPIARATGGVLQDLFTVLILGLIGAGVITFAGPNVDVIAETARRAPARAAVVGLAGTVLLFPVWILGCIALAVSIIGIPVAIAWLPLFPLAAAVAAVLGYLAVARNAGEWLADSGYPWTGWIRRSNSLLTMVGGLMGLMAFFIAANVIRLAPFLGFLTVLLGIVGGIVTFAAVQIGFGAVLMTRAGRKREYWYDPDEAWEAAMRVDVDEPADASEEKKDGEKDDA